MERCGTVWCVKCDIVFPLFPFCYCLVHSLPHVLTPPTHPPTHPPTPQAVERIALPPLGEDGVTVEEYMKRVESLWAKCVEVRVFMHNGLVFKNESENVNMPLMNGTKVSGGETGW